jgi:hypothetical protein
MEDAITSKHLEKETVHQGYLHPEFQLPEGGRYPHENVHRRVHLLGLCTAPHFSDAVYQYFP